jgi:hypothetical protein
MIVTEENVSASSSDEERGTTSADAHEMRRSTLQERRKEIDLLSGRFRDDGQSSGVATSMLALTRQWLLRASSSSPLLQLEGACGPSTVVTTSAVVLGDDSSRSARASSARATAGGKTSPTTRWLASSASYARRL